MLLSRYDSGASGKASRGAGSVYTCDECIDLCDDITEGEGASPQPEQTSSSETGAEPVGGHPPPSLGGRPTVAELVVSSGWTSIVWVRHFGAQLCGAARGRRLGTEYDEGLTMLKGRRGAHIGALVCDWKYGAIGDR